MQCWSLTERYPAINPLDEYGTCLTSTCIIWKKPEQIRVVFDSSTEYQGKSLNRELLAGPDLMNTLLGVLVRFWRKDVAAVCDVEQMFHSFHVSPEHRILRFLLFEGNNPSKPIAKFQMTVHLFGNWPSRAVATYGLR